MYPGTFARISGHKVVSPVLVDDDGNEDSREPSDVREYARVRKAKVQANAGEMKDLPRRFVGTGMSSIEDEIEASLRAC